MVVVVVVCGIARAAALFASAALLVVFSEPVLDGLELLGCHGGQSRHASVCVVLWCCVLGAVGKYSEFQLCGR